MNKMTNKKPTKKKTPKLKISVKKSTDKSFKELQVDFDEIKDKLTNRKVNLEILDMVKLLMNIAGLTDKVNKLTKKETKDYLAEIGTNVAELMKDEIEIDYDEKNKELIVYKLDYLNKIMGSKSISGNLHLYKIKKEGTAWKIPLDQFKERMKITQNRIDDNIITMNLMRQIERRVLKK